MMIINKSMKADNIQETIAYIKTYIMKRDLSGEEITIITVAFQAGLLRGFKEAELEKDKDK
jgi:hypothetical protein